MAEEKKKRPTRRKLRAAPPTNDPLTLTTQEEQFIREYRAMQAFHGANNVDCLMVGGSVEFVASCQHTIAMLEDAEAAEFEGDVFSMILKVPRDSQRRRDHYNLAMQLIAQGLGPRDGDLDFDEDDDDMLM